MLYKKVTLSILPLAGLLLASECPKGQQAPATISDRKGNLQNNKAEGSKPVPSLSFCKALDRSISSMGGVKQIFYFK